MKAIRFHANIPRYLLTKALGKLTQSAYYSFFPPTKLDDIPEPEVRPGWVKVQTKYAGICGSDVNTVLLRESPLLEPLCSFPSVMGHENVGIVAEVGEDVTGLKRGDRVVLDPILSCKTRGIPLCHHCEKGNNVRCDNYDATENLSSGFDTGWCHDTGGAFSPYYLAHESSLFKVPKNVSDENAVLVEPLTVGIHAVTRYLPQDTDDVIVIGAGVIGIMVITALRALGCKANIIAVDKVESQGKLAVERGGADKFIQVKKDYYKNLAKDFNARLYSPLLEKKELVVGGGADVVFECVGLPNTIEDALRFTKAGGKMVLIGNPDKITIDWSLIWFREIKVLGSFGSCIEDFGDTKKHAFNIALELMSSGKVDLSWMITHKFNFPRDYKKAFKSCFNKAKYNMMKAVFSFDED
ncbi:MAG: alcohol dehydrogenase catalytic domain-containing protein [Candidatus Heimdallarchaeota archaeon]|nr:MAG: alcohol dehydrogenase catalytic domain-containing protein [Candidatus Heimdallarchaeota archaeon]